MKSTVDEIRARFDHDVERFSNLETGQEAAMDSPLHMDLLTEAAAAVTPSARAVLDLGCGAGNYTLKLLQRFPGAGAGADLGVTLVDLSRPMLDRAVQRIGAVSRGRIDAIQGDVRDVDFGVERFDIVMAAQCLHHLRGDEEWRDVFTRIFRGLRPGGGFWIADSLEHEMPGVQAIMRRRWGEYLNSLRDEAYRDTVFAYVEKEDTPRPLEWQLNLLREAEVPQAVPRFFGVPARVVALQDAVVADAENEVERLLVGQVVVGRDRDGEDLPVIAEVERHLPPRFEPVERHAVEVVSPLGRFLQGLGDEVVAIDVQGVVFGHLREARPPPDELVGIPVVGVGMGDEQVGQPVEAQVEPLGVKVAVGAEVDAEALSDLIRGPAAHVLAAALPRLLADGADAEQGGDGLGGGGPTDEKVHGGALGGDDSTQCNVRAVPPSWNERRDGVRPRVSRGERLSPGLARRYD